MQKKQKSSKIEIHFIKPPTLGIFSPPEITCDAPSGHPIVVLQEVHRSAVCVLSMSYVTYNIKHLLYVRLVIHCEGKGTFRVVLLHFFGFILKLVPGVTSIYSVKTTVEDTSALLLLNFLTLSLVGFWRGGGRFLQDPNYYNCGDTKMK